MKFFKRLSQISLSVVLGLIAFLYSSETKAQFNEGDKLLSLGVGVGAALYNSVPFLLTYEQQAFHRNISVGGTAGYGYGSYNVILGSTIDHSSYVFGIRGSYHLNEAFDLKVENLDLYVGVGLGYRHYSTTVNTRIGYAPYTLPDSGGRPAFFVHGGVRYYLHKNIAPYLELGWTGLSVAQAGVTFRF